MLAKGRAMCDSGERSRGASASSICWHHVTGREKQAAESGNSGVALSQSPKIAVRRRKKDCDWPSLRKARGSENTCC